MREKVSFVAILLAACATVAVAQAKPDFSGTWTLDLTRTESGDPGPGGPGSGGRAQGYPADAKFVIKQTATELVIDLRVGSDSRVSTYKLDGSESVNPGMRGGEIKSKSRWEGDRLVTEGTQTVATGGGEMTIESKEIRSLAADGTMVVERTTVTPRGTRTQKLVFKKTV